MTVNLSLSGFSDSDVFTYISLKIAKYTDIPYSIEFYIYIYYSAVLMFYFQLDVRQCHQVLRRKNIAL